MKSQSKYSTGFFGSRVLFGMSIKARHKLETSKVGELILSPVKLNYSPIEVDARRLSVAPWILPSLISMAFKPVSYTHLTLPTIYSV